MPLAEAADAVGRLASWTAVRLRLVERLRYLGGPTWTRLLAATRGREGVIVLDGHRLRMRADAGPRYALQVETDASTDAPSNQNIKVFYQDQQGVLWLGTPYNGLIYFDVTARSIR